MACIVIKRLLGYELCILGKEGTLFYSDPIVVIRKEGFTEIYNLQKHTHETGDVIGEQITTYQDYQQSLSWMSHGTLEDIGGLGLTFTASDITPFGCRLNYAQNGGWSTGEITADSSDFGGTYLKAITE